MLSQSTVSNNRYVYIFYYIITVVLCRVNTVHNICVLLFYFYFLTTLYRKNIGPNLSVQFMMKNLFNFGVKSDSSKHCICIFFLFVKSGKMLLGQQSSLSGWCFQSHEYLTTGSSQLIDQRPPLLYHGLRIICYFIVIYFFI